MLVFILKKPFILAMLRECLRGFVEDYICRVRRIKRTCGYNVIT
jgi:hypothetical protein